jgi:hypothetical protein
MIVFNHAITSITVHPKIVSGRYYVGYTRRGGNRFLSFIFPGEKVLSVLEYYNNFVSEVDEFTHRCYYVEGEMVYHKPHCVIYMNDDSNKEVYFETVEELENFINDLKSKAPHIEV